MQNMVLHIEIFFAQVFLQSLAAQVTSDFILMQQPESMLKKQPLAMHLGLPIILDF
jgi:hypothetical protein